MPRYQYRCACGATQDVSLSYAEKDCTPEQPWLVCRACGEALPHRQVYGNTPVQFKGEGFYVTDSRDEIERWQFKYLDKD